MYTFLPPALQGSFQEASHTITLLALLVCALFTAGYFSRPSGSRLSYPNIPVVGCSGNRSFYLGSLRFLFNAPQILASGYTKYPTRLFKAAVNRDWYIVVGGSEYLKDLMAAPEDVLSADAANNERFQVPHTLGVQLWENAQLIRSLISQLTRDVDLFIPSMIDEISFILDERLPSTPTPHWNKFRTLDISSVLVRQVNSRVFVGMEKARDSGYLDCMIAFPRTVMIAAMVLNLLPDFLKPAVARIFSVPSCFRKGLNYLRPLIENMEDIDDTAREYSTLSRVIEQGHRYDTKIETLVFRFMMINFAAMHSSTYTLTHALLHLATMPNVVEVLRQEVQESVDNLGWTKAGLAEMAKLDSFLRESQRVSSLCAVGTHLKAKKSFSFSDGTKIPAGTTLVIPLEAIQSDDHNFENAKQFDPLRFFSQDPDCRKLYTAIGLENLTWGFGKHSCPGRFYASYLLKSVIGYLLIHCDIRLQGGHSVRPADFWIETNRLPHPTSKIELRRRNF